MQKTSVQFPGREFEFTLPVGYMNGDNTIHRTAVLRKMTGREEAILADRKYQKNGGKLVTDLLHSCLIRLGEENSSSRAGVAALSSADRNYLLLKLRTITFGSELESHYTCPVCGSTNRVDEDLEALPVRMLADGEAPDDIHVELEEGYTDPNGNVHTSLTMRLPTGKDEEAVAGQMRQNPSHGKNALLARCLKSLGSVPEHRLDALGPNLMAELTLNDRRLIDRALNDSAPGVDLVRKIECDDCGHEYRTTLDLTHFLAVE